VRYRLDQDGVPSDVQVVEVARGKVRQPTARN
jgi:hypothetical protein